ncbi:uncharacterized protein [Apostichopus japonicus]|uniref:uncharacterized protein isoform X5 n=1 Tax=Stichopus japonicus TaxID=307972 RepID=UPI003AB299A6
MLTIVLQWKGLLKCSNHSFSLRWTLISLAMERALEVFQPFLFLKMDVNITGRLTECNDMQLMCNKQIRRLKTASVTIVVVQWKGLLKCSNHSFSLRWTLISLAMERVLEVFQPFLCLKMDVNITGNGKGSGSVPTIPLPKDGREYYWQWKGLLKCSNHSFS